MKQEDIIELLNGCLEPPIQLYTLNVSSHGSNYLIDLALDNLENKYGSVSIQDCEKVSRFLSKEIEEKLNIENFSIQVSSAGAERELVFPNDLLRFKGLTIRLTHKNEDEKVVQNIYKLVDFVDDKIYLEVHKKKKSKQSAEPKGLVVLLKDTIRGNIHLDF